jgi:hypothetical protein
MLTYGINISNSLSCRTKENYPLDVLDADRKGMLKEIIIVYGAIIFQRHPSK